MRKSKRRKKRHRSQSADLDITAESARVVTADIKLNATIVIHSTASVRRVGGV
jgi:hypothetical protein